MICPTCQLTGEDVEMTKVEVKCPANPQTGDVWTIPEWECPKNPEHNEPYDGEDRDDDAEFDSERDKNIAY